MEKFLQNNRISILISQYKYWKNKREIKMNSKLQMKISMAKIFMNNNNELNYIHIKGQDKLDDHTSHKVLAHHLPPILASLYTHSHPNSFQNYYSTANKEYCKPPHSHQNQFGNQIQSLLVRDWTNNHLDSNLLRHRSRQHNRES
jgi:hypothetical protein